MGFTPHDSPHHWYEQPYFTYTRYLLAKGSHSDALTLLENMQTRARGESRLGKLITILVLQALCLEAEGERSGAVQKVEDALAIAAPQEYRRTFLNEGTNLLPLLVKARHVAPAFVDELCLAFQSPGIVTGDVDELIEPLTEREREILRLVARGLSNGEIAKTLFITLGTVKKHLNNIFRKLEVKSRIQAVTRGKEFGLLE
jgi:LuxR family maltose regulon positive regulatory protein